MADELRRFFRLALYFCIGLFLGGWAVLANATVYPSYVYTAGSSAGPYYSSVSLAVTSYVQASMPGYTVAASGCVDPVFNNGTLTNLGSLGCTVNYSNSSGAFGSFWKGISGYRQQCPTNSTGTTTCTCNTGYAELNGQCVQNNCTTGGSTSFRGFAGWSICDGSDLKCSVGANGGAYTYPSSVCDGQCGVAVSGLTSGSCSANPGGSPDSPQAIACTYQGKYDGSVCGASTIPQAGTPPNVVKQQTPCTPSQGVMTSSTGRVVCVDSATPTARTPTVSSSTSTKTAPDNSTATTTTTKTTDPATNATNTDTTTTVVAGPGGTSQAGPPGTTTQSDNTAPTKNPQPDPTYTYNSPGTDGLYTKKDGTVSGVLSKFNASANAAPFVSAAQGFLGVSGMSGGSCPGLSVGVPYLSTSIDLSSVFCGSAGTNMMDMTGAVLLVVAAMAAFRWAFL